MKDKKLKGGITLGRFTLPIDKVDDVVLKEIIERFGVDAIRDSDGTVYSDELLALGLKVYRTYLTTRNDQEWAMAHPEELQQVFLSSEPQIATSDKLEINIMKGIFSEQFKVSDAAYHDYWEVYDRTTAQKLATTDWFYDKESETVQVNAIPYHEYTVSFLAYQIWDPTQMYNHLTNDWKDRHHEMPYDMRHEQTREHILSYLSQWLRENEEVDVVRFTTFFYHFTLIYNELKQEKFVDWFGYSASLSREAMDAFKEEYGYTLCAEDIVDEGYFNSPFRIPSRQYLDFIDFQSRFVSEQAKKMVDLVHEAGKEAMMFLGDNWIGTEPYGPYFEQIGVDAVVGSVGNGTTLRMIADIPHIRYTEGRFLPYFFPDVFCDEGDPVGEAVQNWIQGRRALLQSPLDRIGYGGYLSLALKFPDFLTTVEKITAEFNLIHEKIKQTRAKKASFKVAILNCYGHLRSWQTNQVAHALWYKEIYSYVGVLEILSGLSFDVEFISFEDILTEGISDDIGVIINAGDAMTAWSGGENWLNEEVVTKIRRFVYEGGGFIGVGEPSAVTHQGKYFQLFDVLGVDKELTYGLSYRKDYSLTKTHFLLEQLEGDIDFGEGMKGIFKKGDHTELLVVRDQSVQLATNEVGLGRSVYFSGLPYSANNARLLKRALYYAAHKELELAEIEVSHVETECVYYEEVKQLIVYNNSQERVETTISFKGQPYQTIELAGGASMWFDLSQS